MMNQKRIAHLLKKYNRGTCDPLEKSMVEDWLKDRNGREISLDSGQLFEVKNNIKKSVDRQVKKNKQRKKQLKRAVICVAVIGIGFTGYWLRHLPSQEQAVWYTIQAGPKELVKIKLPDGTKVLLNRNSQLSYPKGFNAHERRVNLQHGKAYFDVAKEERRPFFVHAAGSETRVLGTAFSVQTAASGTATTVTVAQGKVGVYSTRTSEKKAMSQMLLLFPNEQAVIRQNGQTDKRQVNALQINAWNRLVFNNASIQEVITTLSKVYGIELSVERETIGEIRFSASFNYTDKPKDVLFEIATANNLKYQFDGRSGVLYRSLK